MSAPSSDGRPASAAQTFGSESSVTRVEGEGEGDGGTVSWGERSRTVSRGGLSGGQEMAGEGRTGSREGRIGSREGRVESREARTASGGASREGTSHGSSPLGAEAIDELDFAHRRHRTGRAGGGFLLDAGFQSKGRAKGKHRMADDLRVPKARSSMSAAETNQMSQTSHTRAVDATQLVHMALNLSESRRRNISASQLLASPRRDGSLAHPGTNKPPSAGRGDSLRQYLHDQRRASRNMSPKSPGRHLSTSMQRSGSMAFAAVNPSSATLLRRDKARAYIELRAQYMRLLQFLPPLKPDANAPGNFTYSSTAVPGSPQAQLTRTPSYANKQHDLGRPYNPIQALRNRRIRARERLALLHDPPAFADADHITDWVDQIEDLATRPSYRREDGVSLPQLHTNHDIQTEPAKPSKAQQGWSFTPEELLADVFWLEHGDNKAIIEDRNGRKLFPTREPPKPQKHDFFFPRSSREYSEKRGAPGTADATTGDESEQGSERGRKRRLLPTIRADSRLRKGRGSPRKHSIGYSDSSDSDDDARKVRKSFDTEYNTGPLALQLKKRLELQTKGIDSKSPAAFTPDTPNKWGRVLDDVPDGKVSRNSLEVPRFTNGSARIDENATLRMPPKNRSNPLSPIKSAGPRSSFEEDSTAPSTPLHARHFPHMETDLSPPPSRAGSDLGKTKRTKLNLFHSHHHADKNDSRHDLEGTGLDKKQHSRQTSEEPHEGSSLGIAIFAAPGAVKNLLSHRKNDSVSSLPSPDKLRRKEAQDSKEPHSAVTRFFKGVKHEGTKVGDIIFRRDRAEDTDASTVSDRNSVEFDNDAQHGRPALSRTVTSTTTGSVTSEKDGRYHLKLPSFRPAHEVLSDDDTSDLEHHISRQSRERRNTRSTRIDRLLPPRMDLERMPSASSTVTLEPAHSRDIDQMSKQLARPGGVFPGALPVTALKDAQSRHRSASRPTLDGKRHWSIADDNDEHALGRKPRHTPISQSDIARVRALFLCSGIKAKEIARRAALPSPQPPPFLLLAAKTAHHTLHPVGRKQEHILAARILVHDLDRSSRALEHTCSVFRSSRLDDITSRIASLTRDIDANLLPRVHDSADTAVCTTAHVSNVGPLHVKQLNDEVERMLRQRRRHSRWVMSWAWSLVEWGIVVALRLASILFAVYGVAKGVVRALWGIVRWLLWL